MRLFNILLPFFALALLACNAAVGDTKSSQRAAVPVACTVSGSPKTPQVPAGVCDAFVASLVASGVPAVKTAQAQSSDIILVVEDVSSNRMTARIDTRSGGVLIPGSSRAIARKGAPLDGAAYPAFLRALISATSGL